MDGRSTVPEPGFSMGRWIMMHDEEAARIWLTDGDVPRVAALLRIDPLIPTGGCADGDTSRQ